MKAFIQRVAKAQVLVDGKIISSIGPGLVTLLGVAKGDDELKAKKLTEKIVNLRIFEDASGKMNISLLELANVGKGEHLIVSQFTLLADCSQGRRPSFTLAETPQAARTLYEVSLSESLRLGVPTFGGQFQAHMKVELVNDGPASFWIEL
jgi:D-tyrosyl-tRNA(Tyr) deacylase